MKLYTYFRSSSSFRVRIALNLKDIAYEPVFVHLVKGEQSSEAYKAKNPMGLVPALEVDGKVLAESVAIIEYLDEVAPAPAFLPEEPMDRAVVRAMVNVIACGIQPLNNLAVLKYLKEPLGKEQADVDQWYTHWIERGFEAMEKMVAEHGGAYCFGDKVTMADVFLIPQIWNGRRFNTDMTPYPNLMRVEEALYQIDAFDKAKPENQPDAAA